MSEELKSGHGRDKEFEPDDPLELVPVAVPGGDPGLMATCIVEEFARLGLDEEEIFRLFQQPIYQTHAFYRERGEAWVRALIRKVLARSGRLRVSMTLFPPSGGCDA